MGFRQLRSTSGGEKTLGEREGTLHRRVNRKTPRKPGREGEGRREKEERPTAGNPGIFYGWSRDIIILSPSKLGQETIRTEGVKKEEDFPNRDTGQLEKR